MPAGAREGASRRGERQESMPQVQPFQAGFALPSARSGLKEHETLVSCFDGIV